MHRRLHVSRETKMSSNVGVCQWQHLRVVCSNMRTQQAAESRIVCMAHSLHKITYTQKSERGRKPNYCGGQRNSKCCSLFRSAGAARLQ